MKKEELYGTEEGLRSEEENAVSTEAIDFEESSFIEANKHKGEVIGDTEDGPDDDGRKYEDEIKDTSDEYNKKAASTSKKKESEIDEEEHMDKVLREIAEQPIEVAMANLEVEPQELIDAAREVFEKGYFEMRFSLPFGNSVKLRSKTVNDFVDYTEYVRRLLLNPISKKEFDTLTQMRSLTYAIVEIDGDDWSQLDIEKRFEMILGMSEQKITAIINATVKFWRIAHLLLHPKLYDFLLQSPEEQSSGR